MQMKRALKRDQENREPEVYEGSKTSTTIKEPHLHCPISNIVTEKNTLHVVLRSFVVHDSGSRSTKSIPRRYDLRKFTLLHSYHI